MAVDLPGIRASLEISLDLFRQQQQQVKQALADMGRDLAQVPPLRLTVDTAALDRQSTQVQQAAGKLTSIQDREAQRALALQVAADAKADAQRAAALAKAEAQLNASLARQAASEDRAARQRQVADLKDFDQRLRAASGPTPLPVSVTNLPDAASVQNLLRQLQALGPAQADVAKLGTAFGQLNTTLGVTGSLPGLDKLIGLGPALLGAAAGPLAAAVAVGVLAKATYDMGVAWDTAHDQIALATGATGARLAGLQADFDALAATGKSSLEALSQTFGALAARTGATGPALQQITSDVLLFAKLTGTDLPTAVQSGTAAMTAYGLSAADSGKFFDLLTAAQQETGAKASGLLETLTAGRGTFAALGLSVAETVALLAKLDQQGVNSTQVLFGLRAATAKFAAAGLDPGVALREFITALAAEEDQVKRTAAAEKVFGERAGQAIADAAARGTLSTEALVATLETSGGRMKQTLGDVQDGQDRLGKSWEALRRSFGPQGQALFSAVSDAADVLTGALNGLNAIGHSGFGQVLSKELELVTRVTLGLPLETLHALADVLRQIRGESAAPVPSAPETPSGGASGGFDSGAGAAQAAQAQGALGATARETTAALGAQGKTAAQLADDLEEAAKASTDVATQLKRLGQNEDGIAALLDYERVLKLLDTAIGQLDPTTAAHIVALRNEALATTDAAERHTRLSAALAEGQAVAAASALTLRDRAEALEREKDAALGGAQAVRAHAEDLAREKEAALGGAQAMQQHADDLARERDAALGGAIAIRAHADDLEREKVAALGGQQAIRAHQEDLEREKTAALGGALAIRQHQEDLAREQQAALGGALAVRTHAEDLDREKVAALGGAVAMRAHQEDLDREKEAALGGAVAIRQHAEDLEQERQAALGGAQAIRAHAEQMQRLAETADPAAAATQALAASAKSMLDTLSAGLPAADRAWLQYTAARQGDAATLRSLYAQMGGDLDAFDHATEAQQQRSIARLAQARQAAEVFHSTGRLLPAPQETDLLGPQRQQQVEDQTRAQARQADDLRVQAARTAADRQRQDADFQRQGAQIDADFATRQRDIANTLDTAQAQINHARGVAETDFHRGQLRDLEDFNQAWVRQERDRAQQDAESLRGLREQAGDLLVGATSQFHAAAAQAVEGLLGLSGSALGSAAAGVVDRFQGMSDAAQDAARQVTDAQQSMLDKVRDTFQQINRQASDTIKGIRDQLLQAGQNGNTPSLFGGIFTNLPGQGSAEQQAALKATADRNQAILDANLKIADTATKQQSILDTAQKARADLDKAAADADKDLQKQLLDQAKQARDQRAQMISQLTRMVEGFQRSAFQTEQQRTDQREDQGLARDRQVEDQQRAFERQVNEFLAQQRAAGQAAIDAARANERQRDEQRRQLQEQERQVAEQRRRADEDLETARRRREEDLRIAEDRFQEQVRLARHQIDQGDQAHRDLTAIQDTLERRQPGVQQNFNLPNMVLVEPATQFLDIGFEELRNIRVARTVA